MIELIPGFHYPDTTPGVYEEETYSVVDLAAKTAAKTNECVAKVNAMDAQHDAMVTATGAANTAAGAANTAAGNAATTAAAAVSSANAAATSANNAATNANNAAAAAAQGYNSIDEMLRHGRGRFVAHRGGNHLFPENTMPAFAHAAQSGHFFGVETDVQETIDGEFVLMHDDTVDRTTDGTGSIRTMTLAQVKALTVDYTAVADAVGFYPGLKVPTLNELLTMIKNYHCFPFIEIKGIDSYDRFVWRIRKLGLEERAAIIGSITDLETVREYSTKIVGVMNATFTTANVDALAALGNCCISVAPEQVTDELVQYAHDHRVRVVSYPVDEPAVAKSQFDMGVDLMTTDSVIY